MLVSIKDLYIFAALNNRVYIESFSTMLCPVTFGQFFSSSNRPQNQLFLLVLEKKKSEKNMVTFKLERGEKGKSAAKIVLIK